MQRAVYVVSLIVLLLGSAFICAGWAQDTVTIEGKIFDRETKDPLPAYVMLEDDGPGVTADAGGLFKLRARLSNSARTVRLSVWLIGYKKKKVEAKIGEYLSISLDLEPLAVHEIVVSADSLVSDEKHKKTVTLNKMDIYTLPGTAADPVHASQVLPGVNALPDTSSLIIRGGAPGEVGYFFDGIEIRHPFLSETMHESYFSIFDNQVVESFHIATSGFHPKYGDALSGVMDISAKDTINKREGGLGLSVLGLNSYVGWPLTNAISFVGSYDRGFSDILTKLNSRGGDHRFQTEHAFGKLLARASASNLIRVYGLYDNYHYSQGSSFDADSKNTMAAVSWTLTPGKNFVSEVLLFRTGYDVALKIDDSLHIRQADDIVQAKWDGFWDLEPHFLEFGAEVQSRKLETALSGQDQGSYRARGTRLGFYFNDKFRLTDRIYVNLGGRLSSLSFVDAGLNFEPRFSLAWLLTRNDIFRVSAGTSQQFGDYFILKSHPGLRPKTAVHLALSYDRIREEMELRATLYDKEYRRLFLNGPQGSVGNDGWGFARGAELFIKKTKSRYDAIVVYNFLHSKRKENETAVEAPSPYEIRHSLTGIFKWKWKTWSLGLRYSYASGRPFTPLEGREWDAQSETYLPIWGAAYSQRYPAYQRMDVNGSKTLNLFNRLVVLYFGVTNILDNDNVLRIEYADDYSGRRDQLSIFGRSFFAGIYIPFF